MKTKLAKRKTTERAQSRIIAFGAVLFKRWSLLFIAAFVASTLLGIYKAEYYLAWIGLFILISFTLWWIKRRTKRKEKKGEVTSTFG